MTRYSGESQFFLLLAVLLFASCAEQHVPTEGWHTSTEKEEKLLFPEQIEASEFSERRVAVMDSIGESAIAVIQGAPSPMGFKPIRQNNEFYYLSGIESPHAYMILDGNTGRTTLFLNDRDERREYGEGKVLSVQDSLLIKDQTGIDSIKPLSAVVSEIEAYNSDNSYTTLFTHQSPYEEMALTRSMAYRTLSDRLQDPLDNRPSRFEHLVSELQKAAPRLTIDNLDLIVDNMRKIKSEAEIDLIEYSTKLHGEAILEAMRSTTVGVMPYELDAVMKYIYKKHNVQGDAYYPLIHFGPDAYMNHYHNSVRPGRNGDMILIDYGTYYNYYSSDMARMWPANGTFNDVQRELYSFYLMFYENLLTSIDIGLTPGEIVQSALGKTDLDMEEVRFSKPVYEEAARQFIESYRRSSENPMMRIGHGVGLAVHDVGDYTVPLEPGMVFVIEPQFRVPEESIYIRLEDMIVVREDGVDIISDFVPRDIESIERIIREEGLLQKHPFRISGSN